MVDSFVCSYDRRIARGLPPKTRVSSRAVLGRLHYKYVLQQAAWSIFAEFTDFKQQQDDPEARSIF
jgi:hypothetical protein